MTLQFVKSNTKLMNCIPNEQAFSHYTTRWLNANFLLTTKSQHIFTDSSTGISFSYTYSLIVFFNFHLVCSLHLNSSLLIQFLVNFSTFICFTYPHHLSNLPVIYHSLANTIPTYYFLISYSNLCSPKVLLKNSNRAACPCTLQANSPLYTKVLLA